MVDTIAYGLLFIVANYTITRGLDAIADRINNVFFIIKWKSNWQRYSEYHNDN